MHTFTDTAGRCWELALTIGAAKRVKGLLAVDLLDLSAGNPPLVTRLHTDVMLLVDVIWAVLKPEADARGVSDEQFVAALGGEAAWNAYLAFAGELEDFFRQFHRPDLERTVAVNRRLMQADAERLAAATDRMAAVAEKQADREIEKAMAGIEAAGDSISGSGSTSSPASSG